MTKLRNIFILGFIFVCSFWGALLFMLIPQTVTASATTTPVYYLTYDATYYWEYSNGSKSEVYNRTDYNLAFAAATSSNRLYICLYGSSTPVIGDGTILPNNSAVNFSDVTIKMTEAEPYQIDLYTTTGSLVYSVSDGNQLSRELYDGLYRLTVKWALPGKMTDMQGWTWDLKIYVSATVTFAVDTNDPMVTLSCGDNGFSNNQVSVTYRETGVSSYTGSGIESAKYSKSTDGTFPTSATTTFSSGYVFTEEGNYTVMVSDKAGNVVTKYFTIDKTAPTLSLTGVASGGFTNSAVSAYWNTTVGGVGKQLTSANDALSVRYTRMTSANFPTSTASIYSAGVQLTAAGNYRMNITDKAGNSTSYTFTIDVSAPILSLSGVSSGGFTNGSVSATWGTETGSMTSQRVNANDVLTALYSMNSTANFPTSADTEFSSGRAFTNAGNYLITISDKAGNSSSYFFTIDKSAPTLSLSGVASGSFTNSDVRVTWGTETGSMTSQRVNSDDVLTALYSMNTTASFPTSAGTELASGDTFTNAGNYLISISDKAGNVTLYTFTIDKSAPTLSLSGVSSGGFTNGSVSATWGTETGSMTSQRVNSNDVITVRYSINTSASFPTSAEAGISSGNVFADAGNYLITISDKAGNVTLYTFTIDKSAPTLSLTGVVSGGFTNSDVRVSWGTETVSMTSQLSNINDALTVKYSMSTTSGSPSTADQIVSSATTFSSEGNYSFIVADKAGNSTSYTFTIDKTVPVVANESLFSQYIRYTNNAFVFSVFDVNFQRIVITNPEGIKSESNYTEILIPADMAENYGEWSFRAYDLAGNSTSLYTVRLFVRDKFGNAEEIKNGFQTSAWWTVTLPTKIYYDIAGTYSFMSYESALAFAIQKEWDYRVQVLAGEGHYIYVNKANESIAQEYYSRIEIDEVIRFYAEKYISDRKTLSANGSLISNPTDSDGITRADALTVQNLPMPSALSEYAELPLYYIKHDYVFIAPKAGVVGNKISGSVQLVYNGITRQDGKIVPISYGLEKIQTTLSAADAWLQGYYLVTEQDVCGNLERYLVFLDTELPELHAYVEYGTGETAEIVFNDLYVKENSELLRYTSVALSSIFDAADEFVLLYINGRNISESVFIKGDDLPILNYQNGFWGSYEVVVYDRSLNRLTLTLKIAGEEITVSHTSLTSETKCTLSIVNSDSNNAIVSIDLLKISYTGEESPIYTDDDGTTVSIENTSYVLRTGGKYVVRIIDIYGRVTETEPIFYMKGLPVGIFSGVKENGITKNDVKFTFNSTCAVILYVWLDGNWVESNDLMSLAVGESSSAASIVASENSSYQYKFFLYDIADMNLFTEYRFEIDCIAPKIFVLANNEIVAPETVIGDDFFLNWDEADVAVTYYRQESPLGALGSVKYTKGTVISVSGTYIFEGRDQVGNISAFTVTLDNAVSYTLSGTYSMLDDGSYISKNTVTFTVTERTSFFECQSSNGLSITNGQILNIDGTYVFTVMDVIGNVLELTVIIDVLPPEPIITSGDGALLAPNCATPSAFFVTCAEENVQISYAIGSGGYSAYTGELLNEEGKYSFRMYDRVNNLLSFTITIDRTVKFSIGGSGRYIEVGELAYLSTGNISINAMETYSVFEVTSDNGNVFGVGETIKIEGIYTVRICDVAGNELMVTLTIDQTPPAPIIFSEDGSEIEPNGTTNQSFKVFCMESDVFIEWRLSNGTFAVYEGEEFSSASVYYFRITDLVGNTTTFTVTIDTATSYTVTGGNLITIDEYTFASKTWLCLGVTEEYSSFLVSSERGNTFLPDEKIKAEDVYTVFIRDKSGNEVTLTLIIDFTPPEALIIAEDGMEILPNGSTRLPFIVSCMEDDAFIEWKLKTGSYAAYDGQQFVAATMYYFIISDRFGNSTTFTITIDTAMEYSIDGVFNRYDDNVYASRTWLRLNALEEYSVFKVVSERGNSFVLGETIRAEDVYTVYLRDAIGNEVTITLIIDLTPPEIQISSDLEMSATGATRGSVSVTLYEAISATCTLNGIVTGFAEAAFFEAEGIYTVIALDAAGNSVTRSFVIDRSVDVTVTPTLIPGQFVVGPVNVKFNEAMDSIELFADGEPLAFKGGSISSAGKYTLMATDKLGNTVYYEFEILPAVTNGYLLAVPKGYIITALLDGNAVNVYDGDFLKLNRDGLYRLDFESENGAYSILLTVDTVAPTAEIIQSSNQFTIGDISKDNVTIELYRDGKAINYIAGNSITENGTYRLVLTDAYGNTTEYEILIHYINPAGIVCIAIGCFVVVAVILIMILYRRRQSVK